MLRAELATARGRSRDAAWRRLDAGTVTMRARAVCVGLGRIVALYHHSSTFYQIR